MKFSQEFIERVQGASNIVDVISQYTQLKPSGGGMMGRCPFPDHQEKTASFSVSELKQVYHCFGCNKSGNIFTFLRDYQGLSFPQAIEFLADRAGLAMPVETEADEKLDLLARKKKELLNVNKEALNFFISNFKKLSPQHELHSYLKKRNLSESTITTFKVGYALPEWDGLVQHFKRKGISLALAEEARLLKSKTQDDGKYDIFRDRLIFPITNSMGDVLAFGGRIINQGEPKYLNSPETPVFQKGKIFYGLEQTARYIRSQDQMIIVEGYMDLVSLYQAGIKNVVATMGTAFTSDHGRVIRKLTRNVVVLFDGDNAGQAASERALGILLEQDLYPKGLILPDNMDPDDYVQKFGADDLRGLIDRSLDLMNLIFRDWITGFHGEPSEKIQLSHKLKKVLDVIPDRHYRQLYIQQLAPLMGVEPAWLSQSMAGDTIGHEKNTKNIAQQSQTLRPQNRPIGISSSIEGSAQGAPSKPVPNFDYPQVEIRLKGAQKAEINLLALAIKSYANMKVFVTSEMFEHISHEGVKKLLEEAHQVYRQNPEKFDRLTSLLVSKVDDPKLLFFNDPLKDQRMEPSAEKNADRKAEATVEDLYNSDEPDAKELEDKLLRDTMKRVKENSLKEKLKLLSHELKLGPTPEKMERMSQIQKALRELK